MTQKTKGKAADMDKIIGERLRDIRKAIGYSQSDLAEMTGITFQQIQKYENGTNRIAASRLHELATAMETPVMAFFPPQKGEYSIPEYHDSTLAALGRIQTKVFDEIAKLKEPRK